MSRKQVGRFLILGEKYPIYEGMNIIGRDLEATVTLRNLKFSKRHAVISVIENHHYLTDYNSINGTRLRGKKLEPFLFYRLNHKAVIIMGDIIGTYYIESEIQHDTSKIIKKQPLIINDSQIVKSKEDTILCDETFNTSSNKLNNSDNDIVIDESFTSTEEEVSNIQKNNENHLEKGLDDDKTIDNTLFFAATQEIDTQSNQINEENNLISKSKNKHKDQFLAPTQVMKKNTADRLNEGDDTFLLPTQELIEKTSDRCEEEDDTFLLPTQMVTEKTPNKFKTDHDIFLAPTQVMVAKTLNKCTDKDIFLAATQVITEEVQDNDKQKDNCFLAPKQTSNNECFSTSTKELDKAMDTDDYDFLAPTQPLHHSTINCDMNDTNQNNEDDDEPNKFKHSKIDYKNKAINDDKTNDASYKINYANKSNLVNKNDNLSTGEDVMKGLSEHFFNADTEQLDKSEGESANDSMRNEDDEFFLMPTQLLKINNTNTNSNENNDLLAEKKKLELLNNENVLFQDNSKVNNFDTETQNLETLNNKNDIPTNMYQKKIDALNDSLFICETQKLDLSNDGDCKKLQVLDNNINDNEEEFDFLAPSESVPADDDCLTSTESSEVISKHSTERKEKNIGKYENNKSKKNGSKLNSKSAINDINAEEIKLITEKPINDHISNEVVNLLDDKSKNCSEYKSNLLLSVLDESKDDDDEFDFLAPSELLNTSTDNTLSKETTNENVINKISTIEVEAKEAEINNVITTTQKIELTNFFSLVAQKNVSDDDEIFMAATQVLSNDKQNEPVKNKTDGFYSNTKEQKSDTEKNSLKYKLETENNSEIKKDKISGFNTMPVNIAEANLSDDLLENTPEIYISEIATDLIENSNTRIPLSNSEENTNFEDKKDKISDCNIIPTSIAEGDLSDDLLEQTPEIYISEIATDLIEPKENVNVEDKITEFNNDSDSNDSDVQIRKKRPLIIHETQDSDSDIEIKRKRCRKLEETQEVFSKLSCTEANITNVSQLEESMRLYISPDVIKNKEAETQIELDGIMEKALMVTGGERPENPLAQVFENKKNDTSPNKINDNEQTDIEDNNKVLNTNQIKYIENPLESKKEDMTKSVREDIKNKDLAGKINNLELKKLIEELEPTQLCGEDDDIGIISDTEELDENICNQETQVVKDSPKKRKQVKKKMQSIEKFLMGKTKTIKEENLNIEENLKQTENAKNCTDKKNETKSCIRTETKKSKNPVSCQRSLQEQLEKSTENKNIKTNKTQNVNDSTESDEPEYKDSRRTRLRSKEPQEITELKSKKKSTDHKNIEKRSSRKSSRIQTRKKNEQSCSDSNGESKNENSATDDEELKLITNLSSKVESKNKVIKIDHEVTNKNITKIETGIKRSSSRNRKLPPIIDITPSTSTDSSNENHRKSKLKQTDETSCDIETPKKKSKLEPLLPETIRSPSTRNTTKIKHKIVFTMLDDSNLEAIVGRLKGNIVDSSVDCTILVTNKIYRSLKFLTAIALGKPIVSPQWIIQSGKSHKFLDPWDYILDDHENEQKHGFKLKDAITSKVKIFENYAILIVTNKNADVLKSLVEINGGSCVSKLPGKINETIIAVAYEEDYGKYKKFLGKVKVVAAEAIFEGSLKQKLDLDKYILT